ncbi:rod shape-determining protein RodA [Paenibacillus sp. 1011MAR3C5]|uniref:rod shape-determining protein RodA n=1 Tax=Paenibacillus sp. 1011MAR3C5 TaxID=1675787 RepID=UPI000E6BE442|nr:rod shape-determining protein RodA [Paenibacillus sp. 1011MAR3C5]RJE87683.1 rod shape-determining protein RodA [Paenibacillus sp. 1011MAR3C5]
MIQKAKRLDGVIVGIVVCFAFISTLVIESATMGTRYEGLHIANIEMYAVMVIPMLLVAMMDYRLIVRYLSYPSYVVGVILLVMVLVIGVNLNGSTRWIEIGSQQFQPSELMKIAFILTLARFLGNLNGRSPRFWREIVPALGLFIIPFYLVFKQPDLGTSIVFISILVSILWMANMQLKQIVIGLSAILVVAAGITALYFVQFDLFSKVIKPHQLERIQTFIDPTLDPENSWHVKNAQTAIGSGELYGKGFMQGNLVQGGYVPYHYADSIFAVIGEEFGFVGSTLLLLLYFLLIYRMIIISYKCRDRAGSYIIVGIIAMLVLQIFENIAMHTGLMPLTGIALPFVSYGGSSLLTNMLSIGLALSVHIHQDYPLAE